LPNLEGNNQEMVPQPSLQVKISLEIHKKSSKITLAWGEGPNSSHFTSINLLLHIAFRMWTKIRRKREQSIVHFSPLFFHQAFTLFTLFLHSFFYPELFNQPIGPGMSQFVVGNCSDWEEMRTFLLFLFCMKHSLSLHTVYTLFSTQNYSISP